MTLSTGKTAVQPAFKAGQSGALSLPLLGVLPGDDCNLEQACELDNSRKHDHDHDDTLSLPSMIDFGFERGLIMSVPGMSTKQVKWIFLICIGMAQLWSNRSLYLYYGSMTSDEEALRSLPSTETKVAASHKTTRISYALYPKASYLYNNTFNPYYRCGGDRFPLPEPLERALNFTTAVSTDLKILIMGDSVGKQFAHGFEEAAGATHENRHVLRYSWGLHEGLTLSAPVRGGGQVAGWRITGMLTEQAENKPLPNSNAGGWVREDATALLNHSSSHDILGEGSGEDGHNKKTGYFDSMVFRIPHGWIQLKKITEKSLQQTVKLAHELFGVSTVVFVSMPMINNIQTMQDLLDLKNANERLRGFAQGWRTTRNNTGGDGVKDVMVLEFGHLVDHLMEENARLMGYDTSDQNYTMNRLSSGYMKKSVPLVCGNHTAVGAKECKGNSFSLDGMHWCMESIGGRVFAGLACLLGCAHNNDTPTSSHETTSTEDVHQCERLCNAQFMSLEPTPEL
jgi:hypothetical protein